MSHGRHNQRSTFRVSTDLPAEVFFEGQVVRASVQNLSAGGALVAMPFAVPAGSQLTVGISLPSELQPKDSDVRYVSFHCEVVELAPDSDQRHHYHVRNLSAPGSQDYENAHKIVFAAQRAQRGRSSGMAESSSMKADSKRTRSLPGLLSRWARRNLRG